MKTITSIRIYVTTCFVRGFLRVISVKFTQNIEDSEYDFSDTSIK